MSKKIKLLSPNANYRGKRKTTYVLNWNEYKTFPLRKERQQYDKIKSHFGKMIYIKIVWQPFLIRISNTTTANINNVIIFEKKLGGTKP